MRTEAKGAPAVPCLCPRRAILCDTNPRRLAAWTALLLWACALVLAAPCIAADKPLPKPQATVARCFDGDTLKLTDRRVLRLAGLESCTPQKAASLSTTPGRPVTGSRIWSGGKQ